MAKENSGAMLALLFLAALAVVSHATTQNIQSLHADGGKPDILTINRRQLLQVSKGTQEPLEESFDLSTAEPSSQNGLLVGEPITEDSIMGYIEETDGLDGGDLDTVNIIMADEPNSEGLIVPSSEDTIGSADLDFDLQLSNPVEEPENEAIAFSGPEVAIIPAEEAPLVNLDESVSLDMPVGSKVDKVDSLEEDSSLVDETGAAIAPFIEEDNGIDIEDQLLGISTLDELSEPIVEDDPAASVIDIGGVQTSEVPIAENPNDFDPLDLDDIDLAGPASESTAKKMSTSPVVEEDSDSLDDDLDNETIISPETEQKVTGDDDLEEPLAMQTDTNILFTPEADEDSEQLDMDIDSSLDFIDPLDEEMDESDIDLEEGIVLVPTEELTEDTSPAPVSEEGLESLDLDLDDLPGVATPLEETIDVESIEDLEEEFPSPPVAEVVAEGESPIPDDEDPESLDLNLDDLSGDMIPMEESFDSEIGDDIEEKMTSPSVETEAKSLSPLIEDDDSISAELDAVPLQSAIEDVVEFPESEELDTIDIDEDDSIVDMSPPLPEIIDEAEVTPVDETLSDAIADADMDEASLLDSPQSEPPIFEGGSDSTNKLNATLSFDVDYNTVTGDPDKLNRLQATVISTLASSAGVDEEDVEVIDIRQGSTIVETRIKLPEGSDLLDVAEKLEASADTLFDTDFVGVYGTPRISTREIPSAPSSESVNASNDPFSSSLTPLDEDVLIVEGPVDEPNMEADLVDTLVPMGTSVPIEEGPVDESTLEADLAESLPPMDESIPSVEPAIDEVIMESDLEDSISPVGESIPIAESTVDESSLEADLVEALVPVVESIPIAEGIMDGSDIESELLDSFPPTSESIPIVEGALDESSIDAELMESLPPVDESGDGMALEEPVIVTPSQEPIPEALAEFEEEDIEETTPITLEGTGVEPQIEQDADADDDLLSLVAPDGEPVSSPEPEVDTYPAETFFDSEVMISVDPPVSEPIDEFDSAETSMDFPLISPEVEIPAPAMESTLSSGSVEVSDLNERMTIPGVEPTIEPIIPDSEPTPASNTMAVSMKFDVDYDEIMGDSAAKQQLVDGVRSSLAAAAGVDEESVKIVGLGRGSVIVESEITLPADQDPEKSAFVQELQPQFDSEFLDAFGNPSQVVVTPSAPASTEAEIAAPGTDINEIDTQAAQPLPTQEDEPVESDASTTTGSTAKSSTVSTAKVVNEIDILDARSSAEQQILSLLLSVILPIFVVVVGARDFLVF